MGSTHVESQLKDSTGGASKKVQTSTVRDLQPRRRMDSDQTVFKVYKGVKAFDFCKEKNVIVTGGEGFGKCCWELFFCCCLQFAPVRQHKSSYIFSRRTRVVTAKQSTKKRDASAKLLFC